MLADSIKEYVYRACRDNRNVFGPSFFNEHLVPVADCARGLAGPLGADLEVVELAAYLHDLSAICDPATIQNHAQLSAELANRLLTDRGYPLDRVESVVGAIASHSSPLAISVASAEAVCLSNADAVARILHPAYWLYFAFSIRKQGYEEGRRWLRTLFQTQWACLIQPAKELAAGEYSLSMEFLGGNES